MKEPQFTIAEQTAIDSGLITEQELIEFNLYEELRAYREESCRMDNMQSIRDLEEDKVMQNYYDVDDLPLYL